LHKELGSSVKIFCTNYPKRDFTLLDIVHPEASKGIGVAAAAMEIGIAREEVMAVGDNFNDLEMLQFAGIAVVMANAEPALQQLNNFHTTASNDEDGVAVSIERFILAPTKAPDENALTHSL
jgi:5-amino-6-(5-phospho-D-ribitylamino)uracil phosphatase